MRVRKVKSSSSICRDEVAAAHPSQLGEAPSGEPGLGWARSYQALINAKFVLQLAARRRSNPYRVAQHQRWRGGSRPIPPACVGAPRTLLVLFRQFVLAKERVAAAGVGPVARESDLGARHRGEGTVTPGLPCDSGLGDLLVRPLLEQQLALAVEEEDAGVTPQPPR
jgi:hypothetical protein